MKTAPNFATPILVITLLLTGSLAEAETLNMTSLYPARTQGLEKIHSISIEHFQGPYGQELALAAEEQLSSIRFNDRPFFSIMADYRSNNADAILTGSANVSIEEQPIEEYRSRCVERNDKGKCTKYANIKVPCIKQILSFEGSYRLSRFADGETLHFVRTPQSDSQTLCKGDDAESRPVAERVRAMVSGMAINLRYALAPEERQEKIRVLESRTGLAKSDWDTFKMAIALTKTDQLAACQQWKALAEQDVRYSNDWPLALSYNNALCDEQKGWLIEAEQQYKYLALYHKRNSEVGSAIRRLKDKVRARLEWQWRFGANYPEQQVEPDQQQGN
jgi:hypothetical protein